MRFLKDDLLQVRHAGNSVSYVDLRNGRCYSVRPRVLRYGSIELLQANRTYYSRTRQVYANTCGLPSSSIVWMGFYVKMYDGRVPSRCRRMEDGGFCCEPQVCLLEGDEERAYYLSGRLPDQSIVVMDEEGRYYHVEKGHGKRYVACNRPSDRSEDFDEAVALLRRQADERVEKRLREEKCEYERKRQRIISRSVEAVPFQIGVKWGLRTAERILIPPVYRRILHPVGGYCAYQDSSCQWGVLAVDGRIIIRARYMEVEIDRDGTPLPIWRSEEGEELCIGSVEELYNEIEKSVAAGFMAENPYKKLGFVPGEYSKENYDKIDLHRPYVDDIVLVSASGKPMKRESDLIDVWFDSGAMPYAQLHYPFENKEIVDNRSYYPADFIAEGVDQTRGWFFTLHAIATMVFDSVAYKNVISNGLVLDKNGNKMSKRLGNAVDPFGAIEKFGSDPLRWYMITNSSPWDNLKFDTDGVDEVRRKFFGTLYNTYSFFALYANVDGFTYAEADVPVVERPEIDRWILSLLNSLIKDVDACYNDYEPTKAGRLITDFVNDNLSNWYVRLNRKRFWGNAMSQDKLSAYQTLYTCLETVARLMAPVAPFYADRLYTDLIAVTGRDTVVSVHLAKFPECNEALIDGELEARMQMAQDVTSMVLALRRKVNIKVRQPLQCIMVPVVDEEQKMHIEAVKDLIMNEVNVKEIKFVDGAAGVLVKKVKCDFKKLGPKFGKQMKAVAAAVAGMSQEAIAELEKNGKYTFMLDGAETVIETTDVEIFSEDIPGWLVANEGKLTVALEVTVTEELRREGVARELVNRIQNIRKSSGFEITDKIKVALSKNPQTDDAVNEYNTYICNQVLANSLELVDEVKNGTELNFDDFSLYVSVVKE